MRACVVGNGPGALGRGAEIDACDFVARCNWFPLAHRGEAGRRLDAWAWYGNREHNSKMGGAPEGSYQVWMTLPVSRCTPPSAGQVGDLINAARLLSERPIYVIGEEAWAAELACLTGLSDRDWAAPTTGFTAIDMLLRRAPEELLLCGFNATREGAPGWGDAYQVTPWQPSAGGHDMLAEKQAIRQILENGTWLGRPCSTRVIWPDAPEV